MNPEQVPTSETDTRSTTNDTEPETLTSAEWQKRYEAEQQVKEATAQRERDERNADLVQSQTVRFSFMTMNGSPVHLCEDGEFRTQEELNNVGRE